MLERMHDLPGHISGISASGRVNKADYQRVAYPLIEEAKREGRPLRLLYEIGSGFRGFTAGALLQDARLSVRGAAVMERVALVTDAKWARAVTRFVGELLPCPVRLFVGGERERAIDWLNRPAEHQGLSHRVVADGRVVLVSVLGPIATEDFEALGLTVDHMLATGKLEGVVVHVRATPSWQSLGSFLRHVSFVRAHRERLRRLAFVTEGSLATVLPVVAQQIVSADVHAFAHGDLDIAVQWAGSEPSSDGVQTQTPRHRNHVDPVEQAGIESFPASDPPSFTPEA